MKSTVARQILDTYKIGESHRGNYVTEKDINVPVIVFHDGKPVNEEVKGVWGKYPDQKTTVFNLLRTGQSETSLLYKDRAKERSIQYFHIPANNMKVSLPEFGIYDERLALTYFSGLR